MIGEDDEIHFTTFGHRRSRGAEGTSYQAEVSYYIEKQRKDGDLVSTLMRREDTTLDGELDEGGTAFVMIPEIEEIKFEYWDPGPVKVGTRKEMAQEGQWVDSWNTDQSEFSGRLPTRIRITLVLPPASSMGSKLRFTTQTQVGAFEVLEF